MPAYDYDCAACGQRFEVVHGLHAAPPTECPLCGSGPIRKAISAPTIHYKGSGWAKKERHATASSSAAKSSGEGPSGEGGSGDTKPSSDTSSDKASTGEATKPAKATEAATAKTTD
jgi:putative FmdB family regulatory protein